MHVHMQVSEQPVPDNLVDEARAARQELVEVVADLDDEVGDLFLAEETVPGPTLEAAIRRATIAQRFIPVFLGSAYRNVGVQPLLDGSPATYLTRPRCAASVLLLLFTTYHECSPTHQSLYVYVMQSAQSTARAACGRSIAAVVQL